MACQAFVPAQGVTIHRHHALVTPFLRHSRPSVSLAAYPWRRRILMRITDIEEQVPAAKNPSRSGNGIPSKLEETLSKSLELNVDAESSERKVGDREKGRDLAITLAWIAVAAVVAGGFYVVEGTQTALEFLTGYIVEYSLSVDNLFVFLLIFSFFKVERRAQHRVLTYGIIGAMVLRGIMIVLGEALTQKFKAVTVGFALLLIYSAGKLLLEGDDDEEEDLEQNYVVKFARSLLPFTDKYDGDKFFTNVDGRRLATPLMLVLLSVELSDVIFALDSVPAVLGISYNIFVIYLSNILAIMGLRNLFFLIEDTIGDLRFLRPALAVVLGFIGSKMIAGTAGFELGIVPSLAVVGSALGGGVGLSMAFPESKETTK